MNAKQRAWFNDYLTHFNATEAARTAGYKWPNKAGPRLKQSLQADIDAALQEKAMSRDEALARLADIARFDVSAYIIGEHRLDVKAMIEDGHGHLIRGIKHTKYATTVEWADPTAAIDRVLRELKPTGTADDPLHTVGMTMSEWREEQERKRLEREAATDETLSIFDEAAED